MTRSQPLSAAASARSTSSMKSSGTSVTSDGSASVKVGSIRKIGLSVSRGLRRLSCSVFTSPSSAAAGSATG